MFSRKTYLALSLTTALVAASQPSDVYATQAGSFGSKIVDAAEAGNQEDVLSLLHRGINPNERGQFGTSALLRAASAGNTDIAKILVENGANTNVADLGGATALHIAARKGDLVFAQFLLDNKADANVADKQGNTPLMLAAMNGNLGIVSELIKNGAKVDTTNDSGETALHYATEEQAKTVVDALVAAGARKDFIDEEGFTAVEVAARKSDSLLVAKLDESNPNHVVIAMGRGFRSASAEKKQASVVHKPVEKDFHEVERTNGEQLLASLANNDAIDFSENEYLANPSDPDLNFFDTPRFEKAPTQAATRQLAQADTSKNWLSGIKTALQDAGAFELASVKNFKEGSTYSLIELGSFKLRAFAEKRISELQQDHMDVLKDVQLAVFERGSGSDVEYYVNGGVFETLSEAEGLCKKLTASGVRCNPVESAMITSQQFAKFNEPVQSEFAAPEIQQVDIAQELPKEASKEMAQLPEIKAPIIEEKTVEVKPAEEVLPMPELPTLPDLSKITPKAAPEAPSIAAAPTPAPEKLVAKIEERRDDALSPNNPKAITQIIPAEQMAAIKATAEPTAKTEIKTIDPISAAQDKNEDNDESLTALAGMANDDAKNTAEADDSISIQSIVDSIYEEKDAAEKAAPAKPVALAEVKTAPVAKVEPVKPAEVERKIEALPSLAEVEAGNPAPQAITEAPKKEPMKIVFAEPKVANTDTKRVQITQVTPKPASINNSSTNSVNLVNPISNKTPVAVTAKTEAPKLVANTEIKSAPIKSSAPKLEEKLTMPLAKAEVPAVTMQAAPTDKFIVAKPVRVNDTYSPVAAKPEFSGAYTHTAPTVSYNSPSFSLNRREARRMAKVEYFATDTAAQGLYWKYRENGVLNEAITVRATRDLMGKPYYAALIGEFRTTADAQAFCNTVYKAEKLRCHVMDEIDYTSTPSYSGKAKSYQRHSSYTSRAGSPRRHSSR